MSSRADGPVTMTLRGPVLAILLALIGAGAAGAVENPIADEHQAVRQLVEYPVDWLTHENNGIYSRPENILSIPGVDTPTIARTIDVEILAYNPIRCTSEHTVSLHLTDFHYKPKSEYRLPGSDKPVYVNMHPVEFGPVDFEVNCPSITVGSLKRETEELAERETETLGRERHVETVPPSGIPVIGYWETLSISALTATPGNLAAENERLLEEYGLAPPAPTLPAGLHAENGFVRTDTRAASGAPAEDPCASLEFNTLRIHLHLVLGPNANDPSWLLVETDAGCRKETAIPWASTLLAMGPAFDAFEQDLGLAPLTPTVPGAPDANVAAPPAPEPPSAPRFDKPDTAVVDVSSAPQLGKMGTGASKGDSHEAASAAGEARPIESFSTDVATEDGRTLFSARSDGAPSLSHVLVELGVLPVPPRPSMGPDANEARSSAGRQPAVSVAPALAPRAPPAETVSTPFQVDPDLSASPEEPRSTPRIAIGEKPIVTFAWAAAVALALLLTALALGFARRESSKLLEHPLRAQMVAEIAANPGLTKQRLAAALSVHPTTVEHHLRALEAAGIVRHAERGRSALYFVAGRAMPAEAVTASRLRIPFATKLVDLVRAKPGIGRREAARALGVEPSLVRYHARELASCGVIREVVEPSATRLFPAEAPSA